MNLYKIDLQSEHVLFSQLVVHTIGSLVVGSSELASSIHAWTAIRNRLSSHSWWACCSDPLTLCVDSFSSCIVLVLSWSTLRLSGRLILSSSGHLSHNLWRQLSSLSLVHLVLFNLLQYVSLTCWQLQSWACVVLGAIPVQVRELRILAVEM